jgi:hypothetical protein
LENTSAFQTMVQEERAENDGGILQYYRPEDPKKPQKPCILASDSQALRAGVIGGTATPELLR